jgi:hypothetical protein
LNGLSDGVLETRVYCAAAAAVWQETVWLTAMMKLFIRLSINPLPLHSIGEVRFIKDITIEKNVILNTFGEKSNHIKELEDFSL